MRLRAVLACSILAFLVFGVDVDARKSSGRRSGSAGWGLASKSRTTPRPRTPAQTHYQSSSGGSNPGKIGWNVPDSNRKTATGTNTAAKPSAPVNEQAAKSSVSNVQSSGYSPSGGYPRQPATNPSYPGGQAGGYNPSPVGGAPPPYSATGHSSMGAPPPYSSVGHSSPVGAPPPYSSIGQTYHNPSYGSPYGGSPIGGQPYHPSFGSPSYGGSPSFGGGYGGMAPQQPIILQSSQAYKPGIGQLAKEALVFAGVSAGVNAAVNRIIPGGIYGTSGHGSSSSGAVPPASHTSITYNNYYNNGTAPVPGTDPANPAAAGTAPAAAAAAPAAPAANPSSEAPQTAQSNAPNNNAPAAAGGENSNPQDSTQNNPNPLGYVTSDNDLKKLTEMLFEKDVNNAFSLITVNLQGQKTDDSKTDDAPEPLLTVKPEAYEIPTVKAVLALHDNYNLDVRTKETITSEERREESELLDKFMETDVMKEIRKFLATGGYIPDDEYEFKDTLHRSWFSLFKRLDGDASSCGFETIFLAEKFDNDILGLRNWIYYAKMEEAKKLNYLGYMKKASLGTKGSVVKVRSMLDEIVQPATTLFVGTSPELEFALYTLCFFTRPNNVCPISLGGTELMIIASRVNYFGKDILISGYPEI